MALAVALCGCALSACADDGEAAAQPTVERILVLGNSVTLHGVAEQIGWPLYCGMAASAPEKDYVHLFTAGVEERVGHVLRVSPGATEETAEDGAVTTLPPNVLNIADILERQYPTYTNERLQAQIDYAPDLVVLQCGENTPRETLDASAFEVALRTLLDGLRDAGDPLVLVTSQILGGGGPLDEAKQRVCAELPERRKYVDLSTFGSDPANFASAEPYYTGIIVGHPGDKGMQTIADALLKAFDEAVEEGE